MASCEVDTAFEIESVHECPSAMDGDATSIYAWDDCYEDRFGCQKTLDQEPKSEYVMKPEEIVEEAASEVTVEVEIEENEVKVEENTDVPVMYTYDRQKLFNLLSDYNTFSRMSKGL